MKRILAIICFMLAILGCISYGPAILGKYGTSYQLSETPTTVILDAGHGGKDGGAESKSGLYERDIVLSITKKVENYLRGQGINVLLTRTDDADLASEGAKKRKMEDLLARVDIFNSNEDAIMVSIHANASPNETWSGSQTFYDPKKEENKELGTLIMESLQTNIKGSKRNPAATSEIFILKNSEIPSTLVEVGFLSNKDEAALLETEVYQEQLAYAIYEGILAYLDQH